VPPSHRDRSRAGHRVAVESGPAGGSTAAGPAAARGGIPGLHAPLAAAARQHAPQLPASDLDSITSAAVAMVARDGLNAGVGAAAGMAATAAAVQRATVPAVARQPVDWTPFGVVIPVLAGSPGSGASVVAVTVADALQIAGRCVLLADAADRARSGSPTPAGRHARGALLRVLPITSDLSWPISLPAWCARSG
jgi:hypothetical protein